LGPNDPPKWFSGVCDPDADTGAPIL